MGAGTDNTIRVATLSPCGGGESSVEDDDGIPYAQQLTSFGMHQHKRLGASLNARCSAISYARATNLERTMMSAQQQLQGFGGVTPSLLHTVYDQEADPLGTATSLSCPAYAKAQGDFFNLPVMQPLVKEATVLLNRLGTGHNGFSDSLVAATDILVVSRCANKTLNVGDELIDALFNLELKISFYVYNNATLGRFQCGRIVDLVLQSLLHNPSNNGTTACSLFVASEPHLGCLLGALQVFQGQAVPFASHIEIEQWSGGLIRASFNGQVLPLPCGELCPLESFVKLVSNYSITQQQYQSDCF